MKLPTESGCSYLDVPCIKEPRQWTSVLVSVAIILVVAMVAVDTNRNCIHAEAIIRPLGSNVGAVDIWSLHEPARLTPGFECQS
jgi:hypothetical protein